mmetsp:Transcript_7537/g.10198  ORF Transcript_7537/g.10198 Transcript_7537/m.10198 type:complete len:310 (+) Transcript_7537:390-1319(+)
MVHGGCGNSTAHCRLDSIPSTLSGGPLATLCRCGGIPLGVRGRGLVPAFYRCSNNSRIHGIVPISLVLCYYTLLIRVLGLFRLAVKEQVHHHVPRVLEGDGSAHLQDHAGKEEVEYSNGVLTLVVGRDGNVNMLEGRVGVAESNSWDVDIGRLTDRLMIGTGIREKQQTRLLELVLDLIGEGTGGMATGNGLGTSVLGKLEHRSLSIGTCRLNNNILRVLDSDEDASSHHQLIPSLAKVNDVNAIGATLPHISLHLKVAILGAQVNLGRQHELDISLFLSKRHICNLIQSSCEHEEIKCRLKIFEEAPP